MASFRLGAPYTGIKEVSYLFIDGNYLYNFLKDIFIGFCGLDEIPEIPLNQLTAKFTKVFYYDTTPTKKHNQTDEDFQKLREEKEHYFNKLREFKGYHVYEGISRIRRKRQIQKGVDTMIAIDMLRHTFRKNMHEAALLAGDLDFLPLLDALVMEGMFTTLWYDSASVSSELLNSADAKRRLTISDIYNILSKEDKEKIIIPKLVTTRVTIDGEHALLREGTLNNKSIKLYKTQDSHMMVYNHQVNGTATKCDFDNVDMMMKYFEHWANNNINWF